MTWTEILTTLKEILALDSADLEPNVEEDDPYETEIL